MNIQGQKYAWLSHLESFIGLSSLRSGLPFEMTEMLDQKLRVCVVEQRNPALEATKIENQEKEEHSGRLTSYYKEFTLDLRRLLEY